MRTRRTLRPALETLSARIAPSNLFPYDNPILAPVMIKDVPTTTAPDPLAPIMLTPQPCSVIHAGDPVTPPAFGEIPAVLQA